MPDSADALDPVVTAVRALLEQGEDGNRAVIHRGPAWFVLHAARGGTQVRIEAASKALLAVDLGLDLERVQLLRARGYAVPQGARVLARDADADPVAIARELLTLFEQVYGQAGPVQIELALGPVDDTANPELLQAMRTSSRDKKMSTRNALYRQLLRARLLLPVTDTGNPRRFGDISGWDTFAVFTDLGALRRYDPRVGLYRVLGGRTLFPSLMDTRIGSLLINPKGQVGGELYRNEVQTLANAVRGRGSR